MFSLLTNRNLVLLFGCQVIFVSGTVVLVTIGGIVGFSLASDPGLATLPVALMVVGTALTTIPAAMAMQWLGRRAGFVLGCFVAGCGAWLSNQGVVQASFLLFCAGTTLVGASLAFSQQFRFAAAESVPAPAVSSAVSFILIGSIVGAFAAPVIVAHSAGADAAEPYGRAFLVMIGIYAVAAVLVLGLRTVTISDEVTDGPPRGFSTVWRQPVFITAVLAGMVGQGVMTYVMTATPISMNIEQGFSIQQTSEVIRAHVIAMYLPSLVTPLLISRFGLQTMMVVGAVAMAITVGIGLLGHHLLHYWFALVLLGVGWNFLFVSGTTMLTQTYLPSERFKSQALNDFCVFGASACASLLAGTILHLSGWTVVLFSALPPLAAVLVAVAWLTRRQARPVT